MPLFDTSGRGPRHRVLSLAALLPPVLLASSCALAEAHPADDGTCGGATVRIGVVDSVTDGMLFIADERGYFNEEGIQPDFYNFDSAAQMIAPLGADHLDVGAGAPSAGFYNAAGRNVDMRIVADKGSMPEGHGYMPFMVRKDLVDSGEVQSPGDLAGLTVAEPSQGTTTSSTLNAILADEGLAYDDVAHQFVGFAEHTSAFENQAIDAAVTTEPTATIVEDRDLAVRMTDPSEVYDSQQLAVVVYSDEFSSEETEVADCFMRAYLNASRDYTEAMQGGDWSGEGAEEISEIVAQALGMDPELYRRTAPSYVDPDGGLNEESLQRDYEFFRQNGWLETQVSVQDMVDSSFAERAVDELGPYTPDQ